MAAREESARLERAKELYLAQWGALGSAWGVSPTMSRIHALLMVSPRPLNTDEVMERLSISRGNAHGSLKELVSWGLVRPVSLPESRKDHFEAEKDAWKVVQSIVRVRRQREVEPALAVLDRCLAETRGLKGGEARAFRRQIRDLREFAGLADRALQRVSRREARIVLPWLLRFLR